MSGFFFYSLLASDFDDSYGIFDLEKSLEKFGD